MNEVFGIAISTLMKVLAGGLGLCLLSVAWVAWRRPVIFKLGVRNLPRRPAQTALIVFGLMLSTLIIAAALGTGDTLSHSMNSDVYTNLGPVDELVIASNETVAESDLTASALIDPATVTRVLAVGDANSAVDGALPMLDLRVPVQHGARNRAEPDAVLTGIDPERAGAFGGLTGTDGQMIDLRTVGADQVVLSEKLAKTLAADRGDTVTVYIQGEPRQLSVAAVAENSYLSGVRRSRGNWMEKAGLVMPLTAVQSLTGQPGAVSAVAISNSGNSRQGLRHTDAVADDLRTALTGLGVGVDPIKQDRVDASETISKMFTTVFLVLGLFSVASGVLLIVLIFTMLASERRAEMGMARAVGARRGQLIQQFMAEGAGYALVAGLVGAALGVLATIGIAFGMKAIFGDYAPIEPHVAPRGLVIAYCLGMVITFLTITVSSWRISRLNIAAAVRDIPDVATHRRSLRTLAWSVLLLAAGTLLTLAGMDSNKAFVFGAGMNLLPFGVVLLARFFGLPGRPLFTATGLYILAYWLMPDSWFERLFGTYDGAIEMFFVAGICMIAGATILIINNTDVLLGGVSRLGGFFRSRLPAFRTGVAYPAAARGRTGLTIAMFSLIVFSLVMMATMSQNWSNLTLGEEAAAGWAVRADIHSGNPPADFTAALQAGGVDTLGYTAVARVVNPSEFNSSLRVAGVADSAWKRYTVFGMDERFIAASNLRFQQRAEGYATDADIIRALATTPNVAVADQFAVPQSGNIGEDPDAFKLKGLKTTDKVFSPITVELSDPATGAAYPVTIIGIIDSKIGSLRGVYTAEQTVTAAFGAAPAVTSYFVALNDTSRADAVAAEIQSALLADGVDATSIRQELKDAQRQEAGFLYIIQGFMGLGLLVGVAAVGVVAFRSVVERRQQIGMLRAIGFRREMVSLSFLIETGFIVGLGALSGTALGLRLAYKLMTSDENGSASVDFMIPWPLILTVLGGTVLVALLMTWIPARQAGRTAPAEALRYE